jgi:hypothetical protein
MGEVIPGVAVGAVIFPHRPPLPLTQIRPPLLPGGSSFTALLEPGLFRTGFVGLAHLEGSPKFSTVEEGRRNHKECLLPLMGGKNSSNRDCLTAAKRNALTPQDLNSEASKALPGCASLD